MPTFFTRERFGRLQFFAGALLLVFLGQSLWLVYAELHETESLSSGTSETEQLRIISGLRQLHGGSIAGAPYPDSSGTFLPFEGSRSFDPEHSPLLSLVTAAPLLASSRQQFELDNSSYWRWLPRFPFLAVGVLLGASLWYVARRLCSNTGGLIALILYCFSPSMIQATAVWHTEPEIVSAWGSFGAIFTAIAVAHTLYAPREVILWNWRRIVLLGISFAIAVGAQFSMIVVAPLALVFLLYLAPIRLGAAFTIWLSACLVGTALLFGCYFFHPHAFIAAMRHASFWGGTWRGFTVFPVYRQVARELLRACPALALLLPAALVAYFSLPRARYFGNTAPGLLALLFVVMGIAHPHEAGAGFLLASIPFLLIFVSGIFADLMETRYRQLITACIGGLLAAYIVWSLLALSQIPRA
jgi:hypothetical protein